MIDRKKLDTLLEQLVKDCRQRSLYGTDAKPEWQTYYPPELVGSYLGSLWQGFKYNEIIDIKPGQMIITPQASLDGFLRWCTNQPREDKA